jgi:uncharacterized membrane protein YdbT with pleckstrin-like domain
MQTNTDTSSGSIKAGIAAFGSIVFFVASVVVAWIARRYQIADQPMPNEKGGVMTFRDGYLIALILFVFSLAWFIASRRFRRSK